MRKVNLFLSGLIAVVVMLTSSCKKELMEPISQFDGKEYEVAFGAKFNGDVLPWEKASNSKGLNRPHTYYGHVIRISTGTGTWVVDLPVTNSGGQIPSYNLPSGNYEACILPVTEPSPIINTTTAYTLVNLTAETLPNAPFYAVAKSFSVVGKTKVDLNLITDFALVLFTTDNDQQSPVIPELFQTGQLGFINAHENILPNHDATFAELSAANATKTPLTWWPAQLGYYAYMVPGNSVQVTRDFGFAAADFLPVTGGPTYLAFDITGGTGSNMPNVWLNDFWTNIAAGQQFRSGKVLKVTFAQGTGVTVAPLAWDGEVLIEGGK